MGTHRIGLLVGPLLGVMLLAVVAHANPPSVSPSSPQFELESVRVDPPGGEAELLVRRNLSLRPGQMVDVATLIQAREDLSGTGLFLEVELYTMRGSRFGAVIAVIAARPSHHFYLETGVGRDPIRGGYLNAASLRRMGLFGRGGIARVTFRLARREAGLYADLEVPALLPRETDLLVNLSGYREIWTIRRGDSTAFRQIDRAGFRVGARRRLTNDVNATLWGGVCRARPNQSLKADPGLRPMLETDQDGPKIRAAGFVPVYKGVLRFGEVQLSLTRDLQDRLRPWQSGSWEGLVLRWASRRDGEPFWGSEFDAHRAFPVAGTRAAALRFHAVYASADTPYFLRPITGGIGSVRGFPEAGLSGPLGARAFCSVSAEWRHPLIGRNPSRPRVIATLFADAGDHWTASGGRADPAAGVGCGALVRVPWLQTVNLEAASPLTDQVKGRPAVFYLSLGRSF